MNIVDNFLSKSEYDNLYNCIFGKINYTQQFPWFFNDTKIKFPSSNINEAIIKSIKLLDREDFSNYKIIDLRVDGKIIVE